MFSNLSEIWQPISLDLITHNYKGKLICFEGLDGSGKTSIIAGLKEYLSIKKINCYLTKTPSDEIRNMIYWREYAKYVRNQRQ